MLFKYQIKNITTLEDTAWTSQPCLHQKVAGQYDFFGDTQQDIFAHDPALLHPSAKDHVQKV
ncbi:MAG: hypothetical protein JKY34_08065 [Kordiimonadaceae bacterium]|nr:hypothetical protein [Kordiimonadaceae bacterium]